VWAESAGSARAGHRETPRGAIQLTAALSLSADARVAVRPNGGLGRACGAWACVGGHGSAGHGVRRGRVGRGTGARGGHGRAGRARRRREVAAAGCGGGGARRRSVAGFEAGVEAAEAAGGVSRFEACRPTLRFFCLVDSMYRHLRRMPPLPSSPGTGDSTEAAAEVAVLPALVGADADIEAWCDDAAGAMDGALATSMGPATFTAFLELGQEATAAVAACLSE